MTVSDRRPSWRDVLQISLTESGEAPRVPRAAINDALAYVQHLEAELASRRSGVATAPAVTPRWVNAQLPAAPSAAGVDADVRETDSDRTRCGPHCSEMHTFQPGLCEAAKRGCARCPSESAHRTFCDGTCHMVGVTNLRCPVRRKAS